METMVFQKKSSREIINYLSFFVIVLYVMKLLSDHLLGSGCCA